MAKKSAIQTTLDAAVEQASEVILSNAIRTLDRGTTIRELVTAMQRTSFAGQFESMTIDQLATALGGGSATPAPSRRVRSAGPRGSSKTISTRTAEGRAALDARISTLLKSAGGPLRSEAISAEVPAATAQIRQSVKRLMDAGLVTKTGQKRATAYSWSEGRKAARPARAKRKVAKRKKRASKKK